MSNASLVFEIHTTTAHNNLRELKKAITDLPMELRVAIEGAGLSLDTFDQAIKKMPKVTKQAVSEVEGTLDTLSAKIRLTVDKANISFSQVGETLSGAMTEANALYMAKVAELNAAGLLTVEQAREHDRLRTASAKEAAALIAANEKAHQEGLSLMHKVAVLERIEDERAAAAFTRAVDEAMTEAKRAHEAEIVANHKIAVALRTEADREAAASQKMFDEAALLNHQDSLRKRDIMDRLQEAHDLSERAEHLRAKKAMDDAFNAAHIENNARTARAAVEASRAAAAASRLERDYAASSPASQLGTQLRVRRVLDAGLDTTGMASQTAITAAHATSVGDLEARLRALHTANGAVTGSTHLHAGAMRDAHSAARGLASSFNAMWLTWGNILPLLAGAAVGNALVQTVKKGAEFEYHLTFIKALGGESAAAIDKLSESVYNLGSKGLYGPVKLAEGLQVLEQAGIRATEVMLVLPHVMDLATVGEMSMADAARTLVGVMEAFNLSTVQAGHVGDVFSKAAAESQTSVEQMTAAMRTASVAGAMYGATMEDTATALTILAKINITGTAAGTSFRNMLKELYTPTDEAKKAFAHLGVTTSDSEGRLKSFADVVYDLREKLKDYDKISQTNILQKMFGERGSKEAVAMLSLSRVEWDKLQGSIKNSSGFMLGVAAELEVSTRGAFMQAMNNLETSFLKAFSATDNSAKELAVSLKVLFSSQGVVDGVAGLTSGVLWLTKAFVDLAPQITLVVGALGALTAIKVTHMAVLLLADGLVTLGVAARAAFSAVTTSLFAWATGGSLGLAALMTPLGWVTAGVVALGAAWWYFHTDSGSKALTDIDNLSNALDRQLDKLQDINKELIKKIELELKGTTSGAHEVNRADAEVMRLEHEVAKAREVAPVEGIDHYKKGAGAKREAYSQAQRLIVEGEDKLAKARKTAAELRLAEANRVDLAEGAALAEQQRKHRESPSDPLTAGTKKYVTPDRDHDKILSKEAQAIIQQYDLEEKLAKASYDTDVALEKKRLDGKLITQREFLQRRANLEKQYQDTAGAAKVIAEAQISSKIVAAEKDSTKKAFENSVQALSNQRTLQAKKDAESARKALQSDDINSMVASKKVVDETVPDLIAKQKANQDAAFARRNDPLMSTADKAANDAAIATGKEWETLIARESNTLALMKSRTNECTEAIQEQEDAVESLKNAQKSQMQIASAAARSLVTSSQTAAFGAMEAFAAYSNGVENMAQSMKSAVSGAFKGMEDALVSFVMTGKADFKSLAKSILADMVRIQIQQSITGPLAKMGQGLMNNWFPSGGSAPTLQPEGNANGGVYASDSLHQYANTIVSSPTLFRFAQGGAFGQMGEAGPEAIMPLTRGANGKLGVQGGGVNIVVNNTAAPDVTATATARSNNGGMEIEVLVSRAIAKDMGRNGPITQGFGAMFGLQRAT